MRLRRNQDMARVQRGGRADTAPLAAPCLGQGSLPPELFHPSHSQPGQLLLSLLWEGTSPSISRQHNLVHSTDESSAFSVPAPGWALTTENRSLHPHVSPHLSSAPQGKTLGLTPLCPQVPAPCVSSSVLLLLQPRPLHLPACPLRIQGKGLCSLLQLPAHLCLQTHAEAFVSCLKPTPLKSPPSGKPALKIPSLEKGICFPAAVCL